MKKYASLIATPIIVLFYKASVIGILSGELAITAIPINIILYSFMIMLIPIIIAANKKDGFSLEAFNKYNYYTLGLFILLVIVPHIYTNKELKAQSEWKTTTENYQITETTTINDKPDYWDSIFEEQVEIDHKIENKAVHKVITARKAKAQKEKKYVLKKSWKTFLKENNVNLTLDVYAKPNKYESFYPNNRYTNNYYYLAADFPDNWKVDRGFGEYTLYRAHVMDSAMQISVNVVVNRVKSLKESKLNDQQYQKSPLQYSNKQVSSKNYKKYIVKLMRTQGLGVYDYTMINKKIRSKNYLKSKYKYNETTDDLTVTFIACSYQTTAFGLTYTFSYSAPELFYNQNVIDDLVFSANYANLEY